MQMRLTALVIVADSLNDDFLAVSILEIIIDGLKKIVELFLF